MKKYIVFLIVMLLFVGSTAYADMQSLENDITQQCPHIPIKYVRDLALSSVSISDLAIIDQQIVDYQLSDTQIAKYLRRAMLADMSDDDNAEFPRDAQGNIITPYGIIRQNEAAKTAENGAPIGYYARGKYDLIIQNVNKDGDAIHWNELTRIPMYYVYFVEDDTYRIYICVEDLENCGYQKQWNPNARTSTFTYTGRHTQGQNYIQPNQGLIYKSDVKIIVSGEEIPAYNIGGYSLVPVSEDTMYFETFDKITFTPEYLLDKSGNTERVTLPDFDVTINGRVWDNQYNRYPLLVYKDITYFPMTYENARFLGLKSAWYPNEYNEKLATFFVGFNGQNSVPFDIDMYRTEEINPKEMKAKIADYQLAVNTVDTAAFIDSKILQYPVLNFRFVTYFPLTWHFAVDEFGWTYQYDAQQGLVINSDQSNKVKTVLDETILNGDK